MFSTILTALRGVSSELAAVHVFDSRENECLGLGAGVDNTSQHPLRPMKETGFYLQNKENLLKCFRQGTGMS